MATGGPAGQDAEPSTCQTRGGDARTSAPSPVRLTSTSAFRLYAGATDAIIAELTFERVELGEARQSFDYVLDDLVARLRAAFERRVQTVLPTAEAPAADEPPSPVPG